MRVSRFIILILMLAGMIACYQEVELPPEPDTVFELSVTPDMQDFILSSRDSSYIVDEPGMEFFLGRKNLDLDEIKVRGRSALGFQRKSFAVKLNETIAVSSMDGSGTRYLTRFKLISMAMDFTYIENRIAFGILGEHEIMPLFYRFVELKINGDTQGIYLLIEDPEQFYLEAGSEYIIRRGYYNSIVDAEYEPASSAYPEESYKTRFLEIYSSLPALQGEELYNALDERLDLDQYFRKMGIDYLLQNGDYTDELYLYAMIHQNKIRFSIIPWDYDDLFRSQPHEVGRNWGTGRLFGTRQYATYQDVLDVLGDKMIFSIEDDLDYSIAMDPYLYARYESALAVMIGNIDPEDIDALFEQLRVELLPYYMNEKVVLQSQFDQNESSFQIWEENMLEKKAFIKERLANMKTQLGR